MTAATAEDGFELDLDLTDTVLGLDMSDN